MLLLAFVLFFSFQVADKNINWPVLYLKTKLKAKMAWISLQAGLNGMIYCK